MTDQQEIEGIEPMKCKVPPKRSYTMVMDMGKHAALKKAMKELEAMQKQHPGVAGLTLAIAVVARHAAEAQMDMSRQVLIFAAQNRLPIERHALGLAFDDDGLWIEATGESTATEQSNG